MENLLTNLSDSELALASSNHAQNLFLKSICPFEFSRFLLLYFGNNLTRHHHTGDDVQCSRYKGANLRKCLLVKLLQVLRNERKILSDRRKGLVTIIVRLICPLLHPS